MASRTTTTTVTFRRPFILDGFEQLQDAGTYTVDTHEEQTGAAAWRPVSSVMRLPNAGTTEQVAVDPDQLREALMRDGAQTDIGTTEIKQRHNRARGILFRR